MVVYGFNNDGSDHDETLKAVLQIAQANNLKFNPDKHILCAIQVSFFGHLLSSQDLKPHPNKVKCIGDFLQSTMVRKLQSFLYLMNYMSRFDQELSIIAWPFRELTSSKNTWVWLQHHTDAFELIKCKIYKCTTLKLSNHKPS